jgi:hypothetical protein
MSLGALIAIPLVHSLTDPWCGVVPMGAMKFRLAGSDATDHGSNSMTKTKASKSEILSGVVGTEMLEQAIDVVMEKPWMRDVQQAQSTAARRVVTP